jgi:phosphatidylglycerol---prolipoprotein diacylglyceryl transferase
MRLSACLARVAEKPARAWGHRPLSQGDAAVTLATLAYPAIDPVAFRLGAIQVRWYGLAYLAGFVVAFFIARWLSRRWELGLTDDDLLSCLLAAVIGVIVGGRLGYVLFYGGGVYLSHPAEILALWDGGMSFHGGLLGILVAGLVVSRTMRIPWLTLCDLGSVAAPAGLFFGRLANFVNGELWGRATTVPWAMVFPGAGPLPRHPSQLYEAALEGVVLFAVVVWIAMRRPAPPRGFVLGWLLVLYGIFRIAVEFFREPDVQIGFLPGGLTMGQVLSVPLIVGGVALLVWAQHRRLPQEGRRVR